jgi:hypothetical protein
MCEKIVRKVGTIVLKLITKVLEQGALAFALGRVGVTDATNSTANPDYEE